MYRCRFPGLVIEQLNEVASAHGAEVGQALSEVYGAFDERRLERRLGRGKTFDQVLLSAPVGAVELRVGAVVDDHVRVEVLPADGVRDARLALDHHVRRFEELSHHLQQFPESNPNPVIRAAVDGRVLYANPAATDCMAKFGMVSQHLPEGLFDQLDRERLKDFEFECGDSWYAVRPTWSRVLNCYLLYLTDISSTKRNELILSNLARFFSPHVARSIVSHDGYIRVETQRKMLTVFFADLVGFSHLSERVELDHLSELLFDYLTLMTQIAERHGGTVDKYVGDCIMVFFGDPTSQGTQADALACARMALEMRGGIKDLNTRWAARNKGTALQVRMGMHTAMCAVGNFGSQTRLAYTAVGNGVNIAARLEGIARPGAIACSVVTAQLINSAIEVEHVGEHRLKNISEPVAVYELVRPHTATA